MKNLLKSLALTMLVTVSLVSCSKDDDGVSTSGELVGKWEFSKESIGSNGQVVEVDYEHSAGCNKDFETFTANGDNTENYYDSSCSLSTFTSPYTKTGTTLVVDGDTYTIIQLDGSILKTKETFTQGSTTLTSITTYKRVN